jgi:uncharacterized protein YegP (UPF0339 family)
MNVQFYQRRSLRTRRLAWRWRIVAGNGRKIASSSEGYYNKKEAEDNFALVTTRDPRTGAVRQDTTRALAAAGRRVDVWSVETLK